MGYSLVGVRSALSLKTPFKNWNSSHKCKAIKRDASQEEPSLLPNWKYFNDFIVALQFSTAVV